MDQFVALRKVINNRSAAIIMPGASIYTLEERIDKLKGLDICYVGLNKFSGIEESILAKIDKKFSIVFLSAFAGVPSKAQDIKNFLDRDEENIFITTKECANRLSACLKIKPEVFFQKYDQKIVFFEVTNLSPESPLYGKLPTVENPLKFKAGLNSLASLINIVVVGLSPFIMLFGADGGNASFGQYYYKSNEHVSGHLFTDREGFNYYVPLSLKNIEKFIEKIPEVINVSPESFYTPFEKVTYDEGFNRLSYFCNENLSSLTKNLSGQPMFALLAEVEAKERRGEKVIHFEIGDPDFDSPQHAIQATIESLKNGETHYTDSMGLFELREILCDYTKNNFGYYPLINQVLIIPANAVIDFVIRCVANPGDEIICPDPGFSTYSSVINYAGMKPVSVSLKEENNFRIKSEDIEKEITAKTRLIIINSPNNPTGSVLEKEEVAKIFKLAQKYNIYLLTDEVYWKIIYDGKIHYSPSVFDKCKEHTIVLNSFSKIYAMSGWRLGYAIGPTKLIEKMGLMMQTIFSCLPTFLQKGVVAILNSSQDFVALRNKELQTRRDILVQGLNELPGFNCSLPEGSFYAFPNIKETGLSGKQLSKLFLEKANIAVLDGKYFGKSGDGYLRFCYASTPDTQIIEAIERMKELKL